jgi:hypothetical protein
VRLVERHEANVVLFQAFFDRPEFRDRMLRWMARSLYDGIRGDEGMSA